MLSAVCKKLLFPQLKPASLKASPILGLAYTSNVALAGCPVSTQCQKHQRSSLGLLKSIEYQLLLCKVVTVPYVNTSECLLIFYIRISVPT